MIALMYAESPLDPFRIERYRASAGVAFEKHRWLLPNRPTGRPTPRFTFGHRPLRERFVEENDADGNPVGAIPLVRYLDVDAIRAHPLHCTILIDPDTKLIEALAARTQAP